MLTCLRCGTPLDQDFGIVACANCGAVMMIDMDGIPQLAEDSEPAAAGNLESSPIEDPTTATSFQPFEPYEEQGSPESAPEISQDFSLPATKLDADPEQDDGLATGFASASESATASEEESILPAAEAPNFSDDWLRSANESAVVANVKPESAKDSFAEIEDFGNQDLDAGALQFEVLISGIDHSDLRNRILQSLAEPRLALNARELGARIEGGTLVISRLNAARASLIVSRLQHMEVKLRWRQQIYAIDEENKNESRIESEN